MIHLLIHLINHCREHVRTCITDLFCIESPDVVLFLRTIEVEVESSKALFSFETCSNVKKKTKLDYIQQVKIAKYREEFGRQSTTC